MDPELWNLKKMTIAKGTAKGPVQLSNTNAEEMQSGAVYIIVFCIVLPSYVYLYTQFQKTLPTW